jgi:hypothetical protein
VRSAERVGVAALALWLAGTAGAGAQEQAPPQSAEQMESRFQIAAMEAVLEQAVQLGASNLNMQLQAVAPDMVFLTGAPRARGFRLENYGLFFDVDVPVMRRSLQWTFRVLRQNDAGVAVAVQSLRRRVETIQDATLRQELEREVRRIEREVPAIRAASTAGAQRPGHAPAAAVADESGPGPGPGGAMMDDPGQAYTRAVKQALTTAMLEYSAKFALAPTDWLTVAARDQEGSRRAADPYGVSTIVLRVRGSDVKAFHAGQIDIEVARSRVEVREY